MLSKTVDRRQRISAISPAQCRMARGNLRMSVETLAELAGVPVARIEAFEDGGSLTREEIGPIIDTFNEGGAWFLSHRKGPGVVSGIATT